MTNKFSKMLAVNAKEIRGKRAEMLADDAKFAQEKLLRDLEEEKRALDRELIAATDLYPESELSLMVTKKEFDAIGWVEKIQRLKVALAEKQVELDLANETYKEWFGEDK